MSGKSILRQPFVVTLCFSVVVSLVLFGLLQFALFCLASNVDVRAHGSGCMLHVVECVYQLAVVATHNAVHP